MADILIVERDEELRETLRRLLADAGHTVLSEPDGISALTTLAQHPRPLVALVGDTADTEYNAHLLLTLLTVGFIPTAHAYILVTATRPRALPAAVRYLCATHHIPVVHTPIVIDALLTTVALAADRLQAAAGVTYGAIQSVESDLGCW